MIQQIKKEKVFQFFILIKFLFARSIQVSI